MNLNNIGVVILSAGKGTRLGCTDKPKVMLEIGGRPIVSYLVETLKNMGFEREQICLVVGFCKEKVIEYFDGKVIYAEQKELLGTAHAAYTGITALPPNIKQVLVMNGDDGAFYTKETLEKFITKHLESEAVLSILTVELEDPTMYGRVVEEENGQVHIIEKEYVNEEQKKINITSTGTFCFDRVWFENMFPTMPRMQKINEFGLPTTLSVANEQGKKIQVIKLENNDEWFGINTPEELAKADKLKSREATQ
ncbi:MAG TPA: sugar phosphate nucleotidyltransferase [Candidatus Magasanikbacteria bacterium]|nr:sugar phosphate nucleotidyltransferase [Candidatus Magasanikbacteria bacterium]